MRLVIASLLLLLSSFSHAQFGDLASTGNTPFASAGNSDFLPVEEAYQLAIETTPEGLRLYWQIAEHYYLYQHRFDFQLEDGQGRVPLTPAMPPALERNDEFFGETRVYYDQADINLATDRHAGRAQLTVTSQGCADAGLCYPPRTQVFAVDFATGEVVEQATVPRTTNVAPTRDLAGTGTLLWMMVLAFFGGSLLNLMPCVFPVLSLKVLGFANSSPRERHRQSWFYAAGVVLSFVAVAGVLIALQGAGRAIGWGFQLQSPGFVIALAYLFLAMGLALSGVIELGANLMNTGAGLAERGGNSGSFFTGVLAVVVASPCTAPLMGTALGFAVTQPAPIGLAVFAALGAGMAAPLLLLSYSGFARRVMPRPGAWMDTLKQVLAFPLYASAIWLLWVAGRQTGVDTMAAALLGGLFIALGLWLWRPAAWARALAALCLAAAAALSLWRPAGVEAGNTGLAYGTPWSPEALAELRAEGSPVFVDVTADWCITCIANEKAVLHTAAMRERFAAEGVVYMVADWTNYDPAIADFLRSHGRNGIPLYVLYPADPAREPLILPQILRSATVIEALEAVSTEKTKHAATITAR